VTDPDLERVRRLVLPGKRAAERLRRDLAATDGSAGHPYFRAFRRQTNGPAVTVSRDELDAAAVSAELIYVGDFHAVPACQSFAADLLERVAGQVGKLGLGIEFVYTRQQTLLDRRQSGGLSDEAFLKRLHYQEEWGYPWDGYRALLDRARRLDVPVFALDRSPRGGYSGLRVRDEHAARRVESILNDDPDRRLLILFGESHLAPAHLPARVERRLSRRGRVGRRLVVFQNPDAIHWRLEERGRPHRETHVRIDESTYAVLHTPPLEKYEAYRQVLHRWRSDAPAEEEIDFTPSVHHLVDLLLEWLGIRPGRRRVRHRAGWTDDLVDVYPAVYSGAEAQEFLPSILAEQHRTPDEVAEARQALNRRDALYDSRSNTLFLTRYRSGPAAGEAARFLRAALTGRLFIADDDFVGHPLAATYGAAYNEALAYLGAWLVDPTSEYRPVGSADPGTTGEEGETERWLAAHRNYELSPGAKVPAALRGRMVESRRLRRRLAHDLGRRLGAVLFERFRRGSLEPAQMRRLFTRPLQPRTARRNVLRLLRGDEPRSV